MFGGEKWEFGEKIKSKIASLSANYKWLDLALATHIISERPENISKAKIGKNDIQIEFLGKLEEYQRAFSSVFLSNKHLNLGTKGYEWFFTGSNSLRPDEILKLFILTGWKTNFSAFSIPEKIMYYKSYIGLLRDNRRGLWEAGYGVATQITEALLSDDTTIIPADVKKVMSNVLWSAARWFFAEMGDFVSGTFSNLSPAKTATVLAIAWTIILLIPQIRIAKVWLTALAMGLWIGWVSVASAMSMSEAELQKKIEEYQKKQKQ